MFFSFLGGLFTSAVSFISGLGSALISKAVSFGSSIISSFSASSIGKTLISFGGKVLAKTAQVIDKFKSMSLINKLLAIGTGYYFGKQLIKWINKKFRKKVKPVPGSVVYVDFFGNLIEHSGIYVGDGQIANVTDVKSFKAKVKLSDYHDFSGSSERVIYVSGDSKGAVGDEMVSDHALSQIYNEVPYLLVFSNCHTFTIDCLKHSSQCSDTIFLADIMLNTTIEKVKKIAKETIGATKWYILDTSDNEDEESYEEEEPNVEEYLEVAKYLPLCPELIERFDEELKIIREFQDEIKDEKLPQKVYEVINKFTDGIEKIKLEYEQNKDFLKAVGYDYSFGELQYLSEDFTSLAKELENNQKLKDIIKHLGRQYISEQEKKMITLKKIVNQIGKSEILGINNSNDIHNILPIELSNLNNEELENIFYSRLLENKLLTYELISKEKEEIKEEKEEEMKKKGPIIACVDTSGSMNGAPMLKAKALMLAIANILDKEKRSLYVLLFGSKGEIKELNITNSVESSKVLHFLKQGFEGGTDFDTPLKRSIQIIENIKEYEKADILMITDGLCELSNECKEYVNKKRKNHFFNIYTIICNNDSKTSDGFSDKIFNF